MITPFFPLNLYRRIRLGGVMSAVIALSAAGIAQDATAGRAVTPPLPTVIEDDSTPTLPPLPSDVGLVPAAPSTAPNAKAMANPDFKGNFNRPFIGQPTSVWPPQFGNSVSLPSPDAVATLPTLPTLPQSAPTSGPVAQVPVVQVPASAASVNPGSVSYSAPSSSPNPEAQTPAATIPQVQTIPVPVQTPVQNTEAVAGLERPTVNPQPEQSEYMFTGGSICPLNIKATKPGEHPMVNLVPWAQEGIRSFEANVKDYSCVMTKRERIDGYLTDSNSVYMKVMERPFSVYIKYLSPAEKAGQEALYRRGYNNNLLLGHDVGFRAMFGSHWLDPNGRIAMAGQRYPITDAGITNLVRKMMQTVQNDMRYDPQGKETKVNFVADNVVVNNRQCIRIDVVHPVRRSCYRFYRAEIYLDKEWGIPVRYVAWLWPQYQGGRPVLDEEYTFTSLKFNIGLKDYDFSQNNRNYNF